MDAADLINAEIDAVEGEPIRWGRSDCAMWAAAVIRRVHRVDMGRGWRKLYRSERGAERVLTGRSLLRAVASTCKRHGWGRKDATKAQTGDLGLIRNAAGQMACVVCLQGGATQWWVGRINLGVACIQQTPKYVWGPNGG